MPRRLTRLIDSVFRGSGAHRCAHEHVQGDERDFRGQSRRGSDEAVETGSELFKRSCAGHWRWASSRAAHSTLPTKVSGSTTTSVRASDRTRKPLRMKSSTSTFRLVSTRSGRQHRGVQLSRTWCSHQSRRYRQRDMSSNEASRFCRKQRHYQHGIVTCRWRFAGCLAIGAVSHSSLEFGIRATKAKWPCEFRSKTRQYSTSGDYERFFDEDGIRYHHILASRATGDAGRVAFIAPRCIGPDAVMTDALSTSRSSLWELT